MIAIPNMEKPKSCYNHCLEDFIANKEIGCPLKDYIESHQFKHSIHPNCPLIEIVPCGECKHGIEHPIEDVECGLTSIFMSKTDSCSYGERKTDEKHR